jgi:hemerythrin
MNALQWHSWFEIGHERIDFEHRIFLDLVNTLQRCVNGADKQEISRALLELKKYAEFHFISEQNIMIECDYPDYNAHHVLHDSLLKELDTYIQAVEGGTRSLDVMVTFLYDWFATHTINEDLKLSAHVKAIKLAEFKKTNS